MKFLTVACLLVLGCNRGQSDDCAAVAGHYSQMVEASIQKTGDPARVKQARATLPALADVLRETCEDAGWSGAVRRCILEAKAIGALEACDPSLVAPAETPPS